MSTIFQKQNKTNDATTAVLGYYTTFIDINRAEELADAIETKAASLGLKVVNNDAQIVGSKQRADGGNVCRYAVKFLNSIGKVSGTAAVWDSGKVSWAGFEPVELPKIEPAVEPAPAA